MEIYEKEFFSIIKSNFNYKIKETPLGNAVVMPPKEAFIYSCITGSGYLDNPTYLYTPKGLLKLFYNAFDYKFVTGIFDNLILKNTPLIISRAKKYLFKDEKFIVPIEFNKEVELTEILTQKFEILKNPENYIIQRIEKSKKGNGMEPFMEYLASEYFKNQGYIVETQIPLAHSIGSPDFAGYGLEETMNKINTELNFSATTGFHIIELSMIRLFQNSIHQKQNKTENLIVGEAKTGVATMTKQLLKYLDTNLFDYGFEIHPNKTKPTENYFGLITLDLNNKVKIIMPEKKYKPNEGKILSKTEYIKWLNNYIKFYLIANFTNDELNDFYSENNCVIASPNNIVDFVTKLDINTILNKIKIIMR